MFCVVMMVINWFRLASIKRADVSDACEPYVTKKSAGEGGGFAV